MTSGGSQGGPGPYGQDNGYGETVYGAPGSSSDAGNYGSHAAPTQQFPESYAPGAPSNPYAPPSAYSAPGTGQFGAAGQYGPQQPYGTPPPTSPGMPAFGGDPTPGPAPKPKRSGGAKAALAAGAAVLALVAGGIGGVIGANVADDGSTAHSGPLGGDPNSGSGGEVEAPAGSVQQVAANVLPSVVSIDVRSGNAEGEGSGVILSADGVVMTNNHVVSAGGNQPASEVVVNFHDGTRAPARVLGADPISDIAVIKVDRSDLKPITVGTSNNLAVGQDVIAIGAPLGLEGTVTTGIISALNRPVSTSKESGTTSVIDAIQTDAAINPGNSGGALVNAKGALIGINTAIASLGGSSESQTGSIGLGFAIPIDQAIRVAKELQETGKATQAGLGVSVRPNTSTDQPGAYISSVTAGGPADKAGIPKDAVITKVDDRNIASGDALVAAIRSHAPGDTVNITYVANGQTKTVPVTLETLQTN
ncbi:trypsin-like peptidase domain-containing protein [Gordonia sp. CPCC 205515]|uniref:S1C family serine protease n=1 Tax=Gordonia sp. CPCC 205515 TaxID=3140791 RepID=UPI003AF3776F